MKTVKDKILFDYDVDADVLYASIGKPRRAKSIDMGNGIVLRIDLATSDVLGFTIIDYMRRINAGKIKNVPQFENIELPLFN